MENNKLKNSMDQFLGPKTSIRNVSNDGMESCLLYTSPSPRD